MAQIGGQRICGKRADYNFRNATRPDFVTGQCPAGYLPCGAERTVDSASMAILTPDPEYVICLEEGRDLAADCPITSIAFDTNRNIRRLQGVIDEDIDEIDSAPEEP